MKAYFLSGLGADQRAFGKIRLPDHYEPVHIDWIEPERSETLEHYASRLATGINEREPFILVGLSFGGMLACEIAKLKQPEKVIIISSISSSKELPWYFKSAGRLGLHRIIPVGLLKALTVLRRVMGVGSSEDKAIVYEYVKNVDPGFLRWSLNAIVNWRNQERVPQLVHIHGQKDHLLPVKHTRADFTIKKAGHLMILNRADDVNAVISSVLNN